MEGFESFVGVNFWTALFTLINMIITFWLLKIFLFKPVKNMIDSRQSEIDGLFEQADQAKQQANELKAQYDGCLAQANTQRDQILREADARARQRSDEIIAQANQEAAAILEKAQADIELEKKKAVNDIKDDISGIAISIAQKVIEKELDADSQTALVSSFIDELGDAR